MFVSKLEAAAGPGSEVLQSCLGASFPKLHCWACWRNEKVMGLTLAPGEETGAKSRGMTDALSVSQGEVLCFSLGAWMHTAKTPGISLGLL